MLRSFIDELVKLGTQPALRPAGLTTLVHNAIRKAMHKRASTVADAPNSNGMPIPYSILTNPADASTRLAKTIGSKDAVTPGALGVVEAPKQYIDQYKHNRAWQAGQR